MITPHSGTLVGRRLWSPIRPSSATPTTTFPATVSTLLISRSWHSSSRASNSHCSSSRLSHRYDCALHGFWVERPLCGSDEGGATPDGARHNRYPTTCRRAGWQPASARSAPARDRLLNEGGVRHNFVCAKHRSKTRARTEQNGKNAADVHAIHPGASVFDALKLMAEQLICRLRCRPLELGEPFLVASCRSQRSTSRCRQRGPPIFVAWAHFNRVTSGF